MEGLIDLGYILGLWNYDVIKISFLNVQAFNKAEGPDKEVIERRQKELKKKLAAYQRQRLKSKKRK